MAKNKNRMENFLRHVYGNICRQQLARVDKLNEKHLMMHMVLQICWVQKVWSLFLDRYIGHRCSTNDSRKESDAFIQISNWTKFTYIITMLKNIT